MDATIRDLRAGSGAVALGIALAALVVATLGAEAQTPTSDRFRGEGAGRRDIATEMARAAYEARLGWGAEAFAATLAGAEWASTQEYPGAPY